MNENEGCSKNKTMKSKNDWFQSENFYADCTFAKLDEEKIRPFRRIQQRSVQSIFC